MSEFFEVDKDLLKEGDEVVYYTMDEDELNFLVQGFFTLLVDNATSYGSPPIIAELREVLEQFPGEVKYIMAITMRHVISNKDRIYAKKHVAKFEDGRLIEEIK